MPLAATYAVLQAQRIRPLLQHLLIVIAFEKHRMALAEIMHHLFTRLAYIGYHPHFYSAAFYHKTVRVGSIVLFVEGGRVLDRPGHRLKSALREISGFHTGEFRLSRRRDTLVGQNIYASIALTLTISMVLAVLAKAVASVFRGGESISVADFMVIPVIGGVLSSTVLTLLLLPVLYEWTHRERPARARPSFVRTFFRQDSKNIP